MEDTVEAQPLRRVPSHESWTFLGKKVAKTETVFFFADYHHLHRGDYLYRQLVFG